MLSRSTRPPILKGAYSDPNPFSVCPRVLSPHVHFPPTPTLSSTHITHAAAIYDRTSVVISPNECALPRRGERDYNDITSFNPTKGSYFHPRAFEACEPEQVFNTPALSYSSTSESEESDGSIMTPPDPSTTTSSSITTPTSDILTGTISSPITRKCSQEALETALSFLPHPPEPLAKSRPKRRKSPSCSKRKSIDKRISQTSFSVSDTFSAPSLDGCLGGF